MCIKNLPVPFKSDLFKSEWFCVQDQATCFIYFFTYKVFFQARSFGPHYRLQVLNADSFEEKLNNTYKELGISSKEYIPINYRQENELL